MTGAAQWAPASAAGHLGGACSCASQAAPGRLPVVVADASIGSGASVLVGRSPPGRPRASGGRPLVPTDSGQVTQPTAAYAVQPQGDRHSQRWRRGVIPAKSRSSAPRRPDPARRTLAPAAISRPRPGPDPSWGVGRAATPRHHARAGASTSTSPPASPTTPPPARSSQRSLPGSPPNSPQRSQTSGKITIRPIQLSRECRELPAPQGTRVIGARCTREGTCEQGQRDHAPHEAPGRGHRRYPRG